MTLSLRTRYAIFGLILGAIFGIVRAGFESISHGAIEPELYLARAVALSALFFFIGQLIQSKNDRLKDKELLLVKSNNLALEYNLMIDSANAPIFGTDTNLRINLWNKAAERISGYTEKEIIGKDFSDHLGTSADKQKLQRKLRKALRGEATKNIEMSLLQKNGEPITILFYATTRLDIRGNIIGITIFGQDLTRINAEQEASKNELELTVSNIVEKINSPAFTMNKDLELQEWNSKAIEITGITKEEARSLPLIDTIVADHDKAKAWEIINLALNGKDTKDAELTVVNRQGIEYFLHYDMSHLMDSEGNISGVIGVGQDITLQKQAQAETARIAAELAQFNDTANAPIFGIDTQGLVNEWNQHAISLSGYSREEVLGHDLVQEFITDEYKELLKAVLDNALNGIETGNYEFPLYTKAGERLEVLLNATTRRNVEGNIVGVIVVGEDITLRKRAQAEATRIAAELTQFIDTANAPIFGIDTQGLVNEWNQQAISLSGYSKEEVLGHDLVQEFITDEYKESVKAVLDNALNGIETGNYEFPLYTKTGNRLEVLLNATTRRNVEGNIVGVIGVGQDITLQTRAQAEATRIAAELTQFIDTANAPIFGIDTQGLVNEWNQQAISLSGYSKEEVLGHDLVQEFITDEYKESVKAVLDNALKGIETGNYEFPLYTKTGNRLEVLLNATTRRNVEGNIVGVIGVGQDITLQTRAQAEATRIAAELTQFIDTANAPIFGIDTQGLVNEWNQQAISLSGYSKEEVLGHDLVQEFITDEYKESVKAVLDNALNGIETGNYEFPLYTKTGNRLEVLLNATTRRNVEGNIVGVIGVGQDITLQTRAQAETTRIAAELTQFIDTANAPIFGIDTQGLVNEWNQQAISLSGYSKEEVLGHDLVQEFITDEYKESVKAVLDNALKGIETGNYEFPLYTKTGNRLEVLLNATTRRNVEGNIVGVIGVGQDITLQTRAQAETTRIAAELTQFIDTANAPIFGIDTQGLVNEWNQHAISLSGYSREEVLGHDLVQEFITDEYKESVKAVLDNALNGIETGNYEFPLYTKTGNRLEVLLNATTRRNVEGNIVGVIGVGQDISLQKQAQAETTRIAAELTQFIDTANAPIFGIDTQGLVNEWNQQAISLSGYSKEEVLGHDLVQEFITDEYKESVKAVLDNALKGIETGNYEFPLYTKTGNRLEVLLNATTRRNVEGNIVGVIGVGQDITLQTRAQAETTRIAAELTQFIDTANAPIFGIDTQGLVNEWNQQAISLSGYSKEEVLGHDLVQEFITDEYKESVKAVLDNALKGIETGNYEFPLYTKTGNRLEVLLNATTRRNVEGNIVGVIGVGQDITLQTRAQAETTRIAAELTQFIDTANAPIFGIDTQGLVNEWNQQAISLSGYSKEEVLGHDLVQEFITDEYKESVKAVLDNALKGIETGNYEFPLYTKTGNRLEVLLNATTRRNVEGNIVGVIGVGNNITELREKENELSQSQKMEAIGQLTGGIAHDFNNLLSIIGGNLRFLQQDVGAINSEVEELFEDAMSAVNDGSEMTQRLLALSRTKALKSKVKSINLIIKNFSRLLDRILGESIELIINIPEEELYVKIDASQMDNALLNLIINARDAMPNGGIIHLNANRLINANREKFKNLKGDEKKYIAISVTDNGTGIAEENLKRVFEPFFTTKDVGKGSGLGLSMVYGFTQQSNGECLIESNIGKGTTVTMLLEETLPPINENIIKPEVDKTLQGSETILVVEDEPRVRRVTVRDLRKLGYTVIEAEDAAMAREIIESGRTIDMLFSDIRMPGDMDGHGLAIWTEEKHPMIKSILTSGFSKGRDDAEADRIHSFPLIKKPYKIEKLAKTIRQNFDIL